jgi:hypothetical protein
MCRTNLLNSLVAIAVMGVLFGCSKGGPQYHYCYDGGRIWVYSDPDEISGMSVRLTPNGKQHVKGSAEDIWNGLAVIQMKFDVPRGCPDPTTWRPTPWAVTTRLEQLEREHRFFPPGYSRGDYWTNLISLREYWRTTGARGAK